MSAPRVERFIREQDVQTTCGCASRTCGSHRCKPSRWMAGGLLLAIIYAIFMHSVQIGERADLRGAFAKKIHQEMHVAYQQELTAALKAVEEALTQALNDVAGRLESATVLLQRTQDLTWAISTPEIERALQLKQDIATIQRSLHTHPWRSSEEGTLP